MAQNTALQLLILKKKQLEIEREQAYIKLSEEISEIHTAIETLSGKSVWEVEAMLIYDDSNPEYIKGSIED